MYKGGVADMFTGNFPLGQWGTSDWTKSRYMGLKLRQKGNPLSFHSKSVMNSLQILPSEKVSSHGDKYQ
jgi:hypothetical protein